VLDVADDYLSLPDKTRAICKWAIDQGFDYIFQCDDDVYLRPERLLDSGFQSFDYVGRLRGPSGKYPAPYCSGFSYWLSRKAMQAVINAPWNGDTADDRFVGNVLQDAGVVGALDERYQITQINEALPPGYKGDFAREDEMVGNAVYGAGLRGAADYRYRLISAFQKSDLPNTETPGDGPREGNDIISACEFEPQAMERIHRQFLQFMGSPRPLLPDGEFSSVCVLIKTFLRDRHLEETIRGLQMRVPEIKIVVVDDGEDTNRKIQLAQRLRDQGHVYIWLPKDSGFGAKANAGIAACDRPFVLIGSDDFDFNEGLFVRRGIRSMLTVLNSRPEIAVASGRVDNIPYEFLLDLGDDWAQMKRGHRGNGSVGPVQYQLCDLTVNYSLIRREVFDVVSWDGDKDSPKIGGGEHGAFYVDLKRAGFQVAYVVGVNINQLKRIKPDPRYLEMRMRALSPERPCYLRRGIKHFRNPEGICEMCGTRCATENRPATIQ